MLHSRLSVRLRSLSGKVPACLISFSLHTLSTPVSSSHRLIYLTWFYLCCRCCEFLVGIRGPRVILEISGTWEILAMKMGGCRNRGSRLIVESVINCFKMQAWYHSALQFKDLFMIATSACLLQCLIVVQYQSNY